MRIKAIACDVDGTVMDAVGEISLEAVESIERAENTGIPIILATARTPAFIKDCSRNSTSKLRVQSSLKTAAS